MVLGGAIYDSVPLLPHRGSWYLTSTRRSSGSATCWVSPSRTACTRDSQYFDDGGVIKDLRLHLSFSTDGPPYYELLEAQGDGLYSLKHGIGLHHVGVWESDCKAKRQEFESKGMEHEATIYRPDGSVIVSFFEPGPLGGVRVELADLDLREQHEAWLRGGEFVR